MRDLFQAIRDYNVEALTVALFLIVSLSMVLDAIVRIVRLRRK